MPYPAIGCGGKIYYIALLKKIFKVALSKKQREHCMSLYVLPVNCGFRQDTLVSFNGPEA